MTIGALIHAVADGEVITIYPKHDSRKLKGGEPWAVVDATAASTAGTGLVGILGSNVEADGLHAVSLSLKGVYLLEAGEGTYKVGLPVYYNKNNNDHKITLASGDGNILVGKVLEAKTIGASDTDFVKVRLSGQ